MAQLPVSRLDCNYMYMFMCIYFTIRFSGFSDWPFGAVVYETELLARDYPCSPFFQINAGTSQHRLRLTLLQLLTVSVLVSVLCLTRHLWAISSCSCLTPSWVSLYLFATLVHEYIRLIVTIAYCIMKLNFGNKLTLMKWFGLLILSLILLVLLQKIWHNPLTIHTLEGSRIVDEIDIEASMVAFLNDLIIYNLTV